MVSTTIGLVAKRGLDLAVAALALLFLSIPAFLTALSILIEDGRPVLFRQARAGKDGEPFILLKFRSMRVNDLPVEAVGQVTSSHPLVTRVGRVARRLNLDEIPQLINVLRGEMSIVGPRPSLPEQAAVYTPFQRRRLLMRPGMTGWAQTNGNTALTWGDRHALDIWYIDHWSLWLDVRTILRTVKVIVIGHRPNWVALERARKHAECAYRNG